MLRGELSRTDTQLTLATSTPSYAAIAHFGGVDAVARGLLPGEALGPHGACRLRLHKRAHLPLSPVRAEGVGLLLPCRCALAAPA